MSAHVIDVRLNDKASNGEVDIRDEIVKGLSKPAGQKILPQILLYDEEGLRIFDEITTGVEDYYIFPAEENLLKRHANDIAEAMHGKADEGVVLELGAGYVHLHLFGAALINHVSPAKKCPAQDISHPFCLLEEGTHTIFSRPNHLLCP
jgi:uncharacterized SAM-dependent methyltransferase